MTNTNPDELAFRAALDASPLCAATRGAYADWLDEHDRPTHAAALRAEWFASVSAEPVADTGPDYPHPSNLRSAVSWTHQPVGAGAAERLFGLLAKLGPGWVYLPECVVTEFNIEVRKDYHIGTRIQVASVGPFRVIGPA